MNREFLINMIFLVVINLLIKPFYLFGIDRTVQNVVPAGDYGLYFALVNFTFLFQILSDLGIQYFNNRHISRHRQLLARYFPNMLFLKGILAILFMAAVLLAAWLAGYRVQQWSLLLPIAFNMLLLSMVLFLRSNVSGLGFYRTDSFLSVLDRLILIAVMGVLLWTPAFRSSFRIEWFIYAQTAALAATAGLAFFIIRSRHSFRFRFRIRPAMIILILRQSLPYASIVFLMTIYTRIDGVMIERLLAEGRLEADRYASAYRLLDAANVIGFLFASLLFPMFARLLGTQKPVGSLVRLSLKVLWAMVIPLVVIIWAYRTPIMSALYLDGNAYSGQILGYLILSLLPATGAYIYGTLLGAGGALRAMNIIAAGGVALNLVLNFILIPRYQALGAAIATCITQYLVFLAQLLAGMRYFGLSVVPGLLIRLGLFLLLVYGTTAVLQHWETNDWLITMVTSLLISGGWAILLRLLSWKDLWRLLREKRGLNH